MGSLASHGISTTVPPTLAFSFFHYLPCSSGISTSLSMALCLFSASRNQPSKVPAPSPGILARLFYRVSQESAPGAINPPLDLLSCCSALLGGVPSSPLPPHAGWAPPLLCAVVSFLPAGLQAQILFPASVH